jgi:superfamily II DNA or RNA helicase
MLKTLKLREIYDSVRDNTYMDFLVPCLNESISYDRAVGYFSSAIFGVLPQAFTDFAERGGKMRLVCSPVVSPQDFQWMHSMAAREISEVFTTSLEELGSDPDLAGPVNLLAALVSHGCLEIKIAIPRPETEGMFHQKIGIFRDEESKVVFIGSNNETLAAWWPKNNSEKFQITTSWERPNSEALTSLESDFEQLWANQYPGFEMVPFNEATKFLQSRNKDKRSLAEVKAEARKWVEERSHTPGRPKESPKLRDYQNDVLLDWANNGYVGTVCFATGAGKTITALAGLDKWSKLNDNASALILVPSKKLQKQWIKEIRKFGKFDDAAILVCGGGYGKTAWGPYLTAFTSPKPATDPLRIVIAVMATASSKYFRSRLNIGNHLLVIADEMHNLGATTRQPALKDLKQAGGKLGLSATPGRYDEDENALLRGTFGADLKPEVTIRDAQKLGALVPYYYNFETVRLSAEEEAEYARLSKLIASRLGGAEGSKSQRDSASGLLNQRADILKNAGAKIAVASKLLEEKKSEGFSWLVFCNDTKQLDDLKQSCKTISPFSYHQNSEGDGEATLQFFEEEGGHLFAIDMMNEGVDIPSIENALLVASSQNPRQYIQRLGRVLRTNPNRVKNTQVWDIVVVDENGYAFSDAELKRVTFLARDAINTAIELKVNKLRRPAADNNGEQQIV